MSASASLDDGACLSSTSPTSILIYFNQYLCINNLSVAITRTNPDTLDHHPHPRGVADTTTEPASVPGCHPASYGALGGP